MTVPSFHRGRFKSGLRLSVSFAGLALLTACAGGGKVAQGPSTDYYLSHAAGNYTPPGPANDPWGPYIDIASRRFDVPQAWIRQVMHVESGGQEYMGGHLTVSSAGAIGLMQLEPETYQEMASRYALGPDPFNPYDNIMAGTAYIHEMYAVYGSPGFLAAYNAGPGRVDAYQNYHQPLPHETTNYVAMIAPQIQGVYPQNRSSADQLALNTMPMSSGSGVLPAGMSPGPLPSPDSPPSPVAPVEMASLAPPPSNNNDQSGDAPQAVPVPAAAPVSHGSGFSLIPSAMADTPPPHMVLPPPVEAALPPPPPSFAPVHYTPPPVHYAQPHAQPTAQPAVAYSSGNSSGSGWAVQVGAYNTADKAKAALGIAELSAVKTLMHGKPVVASVHNGNGTVYRARFINLPHEQAVDACARLASGPTGCKVLSPDAQS
ncbi:MAG TPA: lytic transglycosylase domain-containing protein [Acidocella sp.]|nr:lytic transglycosylase domain-containing protein [Acidocella sp.]